MKYETYHLTRNDPYSGLQLKFNRASRFHRDEFQDEPLSHTILSSALFVIAIGLSLLSLWIA